MVACDICACVCVCTFVKRRKKKFDDEMAVWCQRGFLYRYRALTIFFCDPGYTEHKESSSTHYLLHMQ